LGNSLAWIFKEKWLWILILALVLILVLPLFIIWLIFYLSPELKLVATILLVVAWGIAAGYKDWIVHRHKEEEEQRSK